MKSLGFLGLDIGIPLVMGNMVMGIMDSGNSLCAIGKPGVFSMGMDFLERKG
jgi:hypothetical protein